MKNAKRKIPMGYVGMMLLLTSGCGTILAHKSYPVDRSVYPGVKWNGESLAELTSWAIDDPVATYVVIPVAIIRIIDLPLSFIADTIMLPLDLRKPPYQFGKLLTPTVDLSGVWELNWTYEKQGAAQKEWIVLTIHQEGNSLTGSAVDQNRVNATVIGEVSGNRARFLIAPSRGLAPFQVARASTFVGEVVDSSITGKWYYHGRGKMKGPWIGNKKVEN